MVGRVEDRGTIGGMGTVVNCPQNEGEPGMSCSIQDILQIAGLKHLDGCGASDAALDGSSVGVAYCPGRRPCWEYIDFGWRERRQEASGR